MEEKITLFIVEFYLQGVCAVIYMLLLPCHRICIFPVLILAVQLMYVALDWMSSSTSQCTGTAHAQIYCFKDSSMNSGQTNNSFVCLFLSLLSHVHTLYQDTSQFVYTRLLPLSCVLRWTINILLVRRASPG